MKRLTAIVLVFVLVFTFMITGVSAAPVDPFAGRSVNLLDLYSSFTWYTDDYEFTTSSPLGSFSAASGRTYKAGSLNFTNPGKYVTYDEVYLYFISSAPVEYVEMTYHDDNQYYYETCDATLMYSGDHYVYSVSFFPYKQFADDFILDFYLFDFADLFTFELLYLSSYNVYNLITPYNSAALRVTGTRINSGDQSYYRDILYDNEIDLPHTFNHTQTQGGDHLADDLITFYLQFDFGDIYFNKLQFSFISTGIFSNYYNSDELSAAGCYLEIGDVKANIPYTVDSSIMDSSWYGLPVYRHTVTVDLSDYDIAYSRLTFASNCFGRYPYINNNFLDWYVKFENAFLFTYSSVDEPWYRTFFGWLDTSLTNFFNNSFSHIRAAAEHVADTITSVFAPPEDATSPDITDKQEEANTAIDDMDSIADEFSQAGADIEENLPSLPSYTDTGLDDLRDIASIHIVELRSFFVVLWDNDFILQLLSFACLFALGGFILFGER